MAARPQNREIRAQALIILNIFVVLSYSYMRIFEMSGGDRKELERRLEQSRRLAAEPSDPLTTERLRALIADIEEQLEQKKPIT